MSDAAATCIPQVVDHTGDRGDRHQILALRLARYEAVWELFLDEPSRNLARSPSWMLHHRGKERHVVLDTIDIEGIERRGLRIDCGKARRGMGHELGDHRIVIHRDLAALEDAGIVAHRHSVLRALSRRPVLHEAANRRQEVAKRVFSVNAALDGPARQGDIGLLERQFLAGRRHGSSARRDRCR